MRDIMERFLVLPFSMGCISQSNTVAADSSQSKKPKPLSDQVATRRQEGEGSSGVKMKNSWGYLALRRSSISRGIHKLIRATYKSFSQILVYQDVEDTETEMEIGFPTDVKHVTHIGYDGSMTTNPIKDWDNIQTPEILSFPSISLKQFELTMAAQVETATGLSSPKCS